MICIVLCHLSQYYNNPLMVWFNYGVQLFFIISGYLYGKKTIVSPIEWMIKQAKKILIPYILFLTVVAIIYLFLFPNMISIRTFIGSLLCIDTIEGIEHLWFIGRILLCYFLTPYMSYLCDYFKKKKFSYVCITILSIAISLGTIEYYKTGYIYVGDLFSYFLGFVYARYQSMIGEKAYGNIILSVTVGLTVFINVLFIYTIYVLQHDYGDYTHCIYRYHHCITAFCTFCLAMKLNNYIEKMRILDISDKYSYYVYIVHQLFILGPLSILPFLNPMIGIPSTIFICLSVSYLLYQICLKIQRNETDTQR